MRQIFILLFLLAVIGLSNKTNAQIPTNGLVGYWPFTGNANDESGNSNNGTVHGATLTTDRFGTPNKAFFFDGTNDYIDVPNNQSLFSNESTISFWLKIESLTHWTSFIRSGGSGSNDGWKGYCLAYMIPENKFVYEDYNGTGYEADVSFYQSNLNITGWNNIIIVRSSNRCKIFINNNIIAQDSNLVPYAKPVLTSLIFGANTGGTSAFVHGSMDDIRIYNRILSNTEITALYNETTCTNVSVNDTTIYYVSNNAFASISPKIYFERIDSLTTLIGDCDSIISRYSKYIYNPTYCSVTDTLIIDVTLTGITPPNNSNTIKIYPNPAHTFVIINTGNFSVMTDYTIEIDNMLGQTVFQTLTNQQIFQVDINSFGGYGTYFVKIFDNSSNLITTRKIILQ